MAVPLLAFWAILWVAREELGFKGVVFCLLLSAVLFAACLILGISLYVFIALQALFDIILFLVLFGHDIRIR